MKTTIKTILLAVVMMAAGATVQAQKFGYINSQELINTMPEVKEANSEIETLTKQLQKKGQDMLQAFQTKYQELQQKQANGEIAPKQLEAEAARLQEEEAKIKEYEATSQSKIEQKGADLFKPIQDRVNQAIKDVAAEHGYTYIFDSALGIILYADDTGLKRAQNAMHMAGFVINNTLYNQLPWIAQAFDEYKKLDRLVFEREEREKKAKKKKGGK